MALSSNHVGNDLPRDKFCFTAERFKILKRHAPGESVRNAKFSAGAKFFRAAAVSTGTGNILSAHGDAFCQTFGWRCLIFARQRKSRTGALRPLGLEDEDEHENDWVHDPDARFWNRRGYADQPPPQPVPLPLRAAEGARTIRGWKTVGNCP